MRASQWPGRLLLFGLGSIGACSDTLDLFGHATEGTGIDSQGESSSSTTTPPSDTTSPMTAGTSTDASSGSTNATTAATGTTGIDVPVVDCTALDLLFVIDTTSGNEAVRFSLPAYASALELIVADPSRPWADNFRIGFVPTQSVGEIAQCQVTGGLSLRPNPNGPVCQTVSGAPWATAAEPNLTSTLQCLAGLPSAGAIPQPRPIALAAARGFAVPPAADAEGAQVVASCTQGFARTQSYKVALLVTGRDDTGSPAAPSTWSSWFAPLHDPAMGSELAIAGLLPAADGGQCSAQASNLEIWLGGEPNVVTLDWCDVQTGNLLVLDQLVDQFAALCG